MSMNMIFYHVSLMLQQGFKIFLVFNPWVKIITFFTLYIYIYSWKTIQHMSNYKNQKLLALNGKEVFFQNEKILETIEGRIETKTVFNQVLQ